MHKTNPDEDIIINYYFLCRSMIFLNSVGFFIEMTFSFLVLTAISQFGNSDYDALLDGVTGDIMHKPNGDIPRDL